MEENDHEAYEKIFRGALCSGFVWDGRGLYSRAGGESANRRRGNAGPVPPCRGAVLHHPISHIYNTKYYIVITPQRHLE